jgi:hypothetical protein
MAALSRFICVKCEGEEIHHSVAVRILCCQCNTPWKPLSLAEQAKFNGLVARARNVAADGIARQRAKNEGAKFYIASN